MKINPMYRQLRYQQVLMQAKIVYTSALTILMLPVAELPRWNKHSMPALHPRLFLLSGWKEEQRVARMDRRFVRQYTSMEPCMRHFTGGFRLQEVSQPTR